MSRPDARPRADEPAPASVLAYLASAAESPVRDAVITDVRALPGDRHALWRIQSDRHDIVLKMFLDAGQARGRRQYNCQAAAAQDRLAPPPLAFDRYPQGLARQILIYPWQAGAALNPRDADQRAALGAALARVHARALEGPIRLSPHPVNLAYQWSLMQGSQRRVQTWLADQPLDALTDFLRRALPAAGRQAPREPTPDGAAAPALVHGDLYAEHCLVQDQRIRFVDWEMGGLGDPARDIAHLLLHTLRGLSPAEEDAWWSAYGRRPSDAGLQARTAAYGRLLPWASLMELILRLAQPASFPSVPALSEAVWPWAFRACLEDAAPALGLEAGAEERQAIVAGFRQRLNHTSIDPRGARHERRR